jgi:zeaxanthin glucosyltransferase
VTLLVISPDFASHYGPLAVLARAAKLGGRRVVVATGPSLRPCVEADGFEWMLLPLGASSNDGSGCENTSIQRFIDATRAGPMATIRHQALAREHDLLWHPERVARQIAELHADLEPDEVLVDHVSFGSTLGMYATGDSFVTLVPGHPSQLPVGAERYGLPSAWPSRLQPDPEMLTELEVLADRVAVSFTDRWNAALATVAPEREPVTDAFRAHGRRVLYNSAAAHQAPHRVAELPESHRFVGPLVRNEALPERLSPWLDRVDGRPQVYLALGTFLSHRADVLALIAEALRRVDARAALAVGSTPRHSLGPIPDDWLIARHLPQVALLRGADMAISHGGNNSVQEALVAGARQLVLPFSTDQFANAADLERSDAALVLPPNELTTAELAEAINGSLSLPTPEPMPPADPDCLISALFE